MVVRSRWLMLASILMIFATLLAACSGGDAGSDDRAVDVATEAGAAESSGEMPASDAGSAESGTGDIAQLPNSQIADRLVIRNAEITISVEDVPAALNWVRDLASKSGGFVFSTETTTRDDSEWAYLTIRVPADAFDATLTQLTEGDLVREVDSQRTSAEDVSGEFIDNEARLKSLQRTEERYLDLLGEANSVDDILRVESELTTVRTQIETLQGRQNYLNDATSFATISIRMRLPGTELAAGDEPFVTRVLGSAWDASSSTLEVLLTIILTVGIVGVVIVPIGIAFVALARFSWRAAGSRFGRVS